MHNSTRVHDGRKCRTFSNAFAVVGRRDECLLCDPELGYKTGRELEKKRTEEGMKKNMEKISTTDSTKVDVNQGIRWKSTKP